MPLEGLGLLEGHFREVGGGQQVRQKNHAGGQRVEELVGGIGEQPGDEEELDDDVRDHQRHHRRALGVGLGEGLDEHALLGGLEGGLAGEHRIAEHGADERERHGEVDEHGTPVAHGGLHHVGQRRILEVGQLGERHNAHGENRYRQVQRQHADERDDRGLAHVLRLLGAAGDGHRALDADEHPDGHHHGRLHLVDEGQRRVGPGSEVRDEDVGFEGADEDDGDDADEQGHELRDGDDRVDEGHLADAAAHEEGVEPDDAGGADDGVEVRAVAEDREEVRQRAEQKRREADRAQKSRDPVAPGTVEAEEVAESRGGVGVDAALEVGLNPGKREERHDEAEHADGGNAPGGQYRPAAPAAGRRIARQREHARADDERDDRGDHSKQADALGAGHPVRCGLGHGGPCRGH